MKVSTRLLAAAACVVWCGACAPTPVNSNTSPTTVRVPQTSVDDQQSIGLCWAYAVAGLVEADAIYKTGVAVNISEEAIGFYNMVEQLESMTRVLSGNDVPNVKALDEQMERFNVDLEGWHVRYGSTSSTLDGLRLVQKYGAVPESVWSHKFQWYYSAGEDFFAAVKENFVRVMRGAQRGSVTREQIINDVLVGENRFPSAPPREFLWKTADGLTRVYSSVDFAKSVLGFDESEYLMQNISSPAMIDRAIDIAKRSLIQGRTVGFSFVIADAFYSQTRVGYSGKDVNPDSFTNDGGHAVLITDFVNKGGLAGAQDAVTIANEYRKPASELDYFVIKNSWGPELSGMPHLSSGYLFVDRDYLLAGVAKGFSFKIVYSKKILAISASIHPAVVAAPVPETSPFLDACESPENVSEAVQQTVAVMRERIVGETCAEEWNNLFNMTELNLIESEISDLTPLAGLTQLRALRFGTNGVADISPLRDLQNLRELEFSANQVTDLSPLRGLVNLQILGFDNNQVADISPLAGLSELRTLNMAENSIADLTSVTNLRQLTTMTFDGNQVVDLSPLRYLTIMRGISFRDNKVESLAPLAGMSVLERLDASGNLIADVTPLAALPNLFRVKLASNEIASLEPLRGKSSVQNLDISGNPLESIEVIPTLSRVQYLYLANVPGHDYSVLSSMAKVSSLSLVGSGLTDISFVAELPKLDDVNLSNNPLVSVEPLRGLALTALYLNQVGLNDLSVVSSLENLTWFAATNNNIVDISPLASLKGLRDLNLSNNKIVDVSPVAGHGNLATVKFENNPVDRGNSVVCPQNGTSAGIAEFCGAE